MRPAFSGSAHQQVVAGEKRHDGKPLHGHRQVAANHHREPICLTLKGKRGALQLLVVLEFDLEKAYEFDRETGRAGDADARMFVGLEHLLDVALRDDVAHRRPPVASHNDAAGKGDGNDCRAVRGVDGAGAERAIAGHHVGACIPRKSANEPTPG